MRAEDDEVAELEDWWKKLVVSEPPPSDMRGLWFGLLEIGPGETISGIRAYVYGLKRFDPADPTCAWLTEAFWIGSERQQPSWLPSDRYFQPSSWERIPGYDWADALERAAAAVAAIRPWDDCAAVEVAGIGFDEGDAYLLWTRDELAPDAPIRDAMRFAADGVVRG